MTEQRAEDPADRFQVRPIAEANFAWLRTRLAVENTLMAWVRTATALIGFGFTIVQFFARLPEMSGTPLPHAQGPRNVGLALIATGVLGLLISLQQYRSLIKYLWRFEAIAGVERAPRRTPAPAVAIVLVVIGVLAFSTVLMHLA